KPKLNRGIRIRGLGIMRELPSLVNHLPEALYRAGENQDPSTPLRCARDDREVVTPCRSSLSRAVRPEPKIPRLRFAALGMTQKWSPLAGGPLSSWRNPRSLDSRFAALGMTQKWSPLAEGPLSSRPNPRSLDSRFAGLGMTQKWCQPISASMQLNI